MRLATPRRRSPRPPCSTALARAARGTNTRDPRLHPLSAAQSPPFCCRPSAVAAEAPFPRQTPARHLLPRSTRRLSPPRIQLDPLPLCIRVLVPTANLFQAAVLSHTRPSCAPVPHCATNPSARCAAHPTATCTSTRVATFAISFLPRVRLSSPREVTPQGPRTPWVRALFIQELLHQLRYVLRQPGQRLPRVMRLVEP